MRLSKTLQALLVAAMATVASFPAWAQPFPSLPLEPTFPVFPGAATGQFRAAFIDASSTVTSATDQGKISLVPFFMPADGNTLKTITVNFTVAPSPAFLLEAGIYQANGTGGLPSTLVTGTDTGATTSGTATGAVTLTLQTAKVLAPGWYWLAVGFAGSATGTLTATANTVMANMPTAVFNPGFTTPFTISTAGTYTLPTTLGTLTSVATPVVGLLGF